MKANLEKARPSQFNSPLRKGRMMVKKLIMIVDDEPKIRLVIRKILEREGFSVSEAESGEDCLKKLNVQKPDLILMDVMMPGIDGWETCTMIKSNEETKDLVVSMLTVKTSEEDKIKSLEESLADWHIQKPIEREKLTRAVKWLTENPPRRE